MVNGNTFVILKSSSFFEADRHCRRSSLSRLLPAGVTRLIDTRPGLVVFPLEPFVGNGLTDPMHHDWHLLPTCHSFICSTSQRTMEHLISPRSSSSQSLFFVEPESVRKAIWTPFSCGSRFNSGYWPPQTMAVTFVLLTVFQCGQSKTSTVYDSICKIINIAATAFPRERRRSSRVDKPSITLLFVAFRSILCF